MAGKITSQEFSPDLIDTDLTSVSTSDNTIPSAKAVKTYADTKQNGDATLTALASLDSTTGIIVETAEDTFTKRIITGTTNKIIVTNGDGVSGNPTLNIGTDVATLTDEQTLTNKTLTTPKISSISNTGTLTLPTATDTLVGRNTVDELMFKTIDSNSNTIKNVVLNYTGTVTLADIKSGIILVSGVSGRTIKPIRYFVKVNGTFTGGTSVIIRDTNGTPVVITTIGVEALTDGAKISSDLVIANVTDGAGFCANLSANAGFAIAPDAAMAGGTSLLVSIDYIIV
jgi:hypothetical protein